MFESNKIYNVDCIAAMKEMPNNSVDMLFTDIPYGEVSKNQQNRAVESSLRSFVKGEADTITFDLDEFLNEAYRITKNTLCIFCGAEQFSPIYSFFKEKNNGSVRPIVWAKTNPSPFNGRYNYLSGVELAVWHKKKGGKGFNAFCKTNVFSYGCGRNKWHPTQKNLDLFKEIITDCTDEGMLIFDPCCGSATTCIAAAQTNRHYLGFELNEEFFNKAQQRIAEEVSKN